MKKNALSKTLAIAIVILLLLSSLIVSPFAMAEETDDFSAADIAAETLNKIGLLRGIGTDDNGNPIFSLDSDMTRVTGLVMLVRLMGAEDAALSGDYTSPFTDVPDWAAGYVAYAWEMGWTNGTSATTFHPNNPISATQYLTFILRALGYEDEVDFVWNAAWELTDELGITDGEYNDDNNTFLRGDMAVVSLFALTAPLKDSEQTLLEYLVENGVFEKFAEDGLITDESILEALKSSDPDAITKAVSDYITEAAETILAMDNVSDETSSPGSNLGSGSGNPGVGNNRQYVFVADTRYSGTGLTDGVRWYEFDVFLDGVAAKLRSENPDQFTFDGASAATRLVSGPGLYELTTSRISGATKQPPGAMAEITFANDGIIRFDQPDADGTTTTGSILIGPNTKYHLYTPTAGPNVANVGTVVWNVEQLIYTVPIANTSFQLVGYRVDPINISNPVLEVYYTRTITDSITQHAFVADTRYSGTGLTDGVRWYEYDVFIDGTAAKLRSGDSDTFSYRGAATGTSLDYESFGPGIYECKINQTTGMLTEWTKQPVWPSSGAVAGPNGPISTITFANTALIRFDRPLNGPGGGFVEESIIVGPGTKYHRYTPTPGPNAANAGTVAGDVEQLIYTVPIANVEYRLVGYRADPANSANPVLEVYYIQAIS